MASQEDNQGSQNSIESVADGIDIWKTLFEPDLYTTLHAPFPPITLDIEYFNASPDDEEGESEHIQLSIFPFYTMNDIKYNCEFCCRTFNTRNLLERHQTEARYCLELQGKIDPKKKDSFSQSRINVWKDTIKERIYYYLTEK